MTLHSVRSNAILTDEDLAWFSDRNAQRYYRISHAPQGYWWVNYDGQTWQLLCNDRRTPEAPPVAILSVTVISGAVWPQPDAEAYLLDRLNDTSPDEIETLLQEVRRLRYEYNRTLAEATRSPEADAISELNRLRKIFGLPPWPAKGLSE